jgi:hypothetical protein
MSTPPQREPVQIPPEFARRIDALGAHFCLVEGKDPSVGGKGWNLPEKLMLSTDPRLQAWLQRGGNYGVVCGYGLVVIEADDAKVQEAVERNLPPTLTVLSGGRRMPHYYFVCSYPESKPLIDPSSPERENVGHIKAQGGMVVGPGSIHPESGARYELLHDRPIAQITPEQLLGALKAFLVPKREEERVEAAAREERGHDINLSILDVVPIAGLRKQGDEYFGEHPVHGSTTGRNFWVNPRKDVWHCFRHGTGGGPLLWLAVEEGIIGCEEAGPGVLRGELFKQVLRVAVKRGLLPEEKAQQPPAKHIPHLNMVENPELAGKPVIVEGVVSSESVAYLCPSEVEAHVQDERSNKTLHREIPPEDPLNISLVGVNEAIKYARLKRHLGLEGNAIITERASRTVYRFRVRPPVFTLERRGDRLVDEGGFEYKAYDVYMATSQAINFRPSTLVRIEAKPIPSPRTQQITLLAYKVEFPEEATGFDQQALEGLRRRLQDMSVQQRVTWILENFERFSRIVGRRNLALAGFLAYFTPLLLNFNGEEQRGWANILFCGDTTTAKTETVRKLIRLLKAGTLITAETASTVGLTGTATQVEREGWFVDWGFLVLLDRKLLAVDGAHKLTRANWAALAEAERSGVVSIAKAAKSQAHARTRQIKIANPVDLEGDKYSTKSLSAFLYPCQALTTILDKTNISRLDLAVFADHRDVSPEEINRSAPMEPEPELFLLAEALKWCWSGHAKVEFTEEAVQAIHQAATQLYRAYFCDEVPLCSIDMKWKLARLSAALAYLTLSTQDYRTVTVTREHVDLIVRFLEEEYTRAGLNSLAQQTKHEVLDKDEVKEMLERVRLAVAVDFDGGKLKEILRFLVHHGRATRDQLMVEFNLAERTELRRLLAALTSEGLISQGKGFYPTAKLIQAFKATGGLEEC